MTSDPTWNMEDECSHPYGLIRACLNPELILKIPWVLEIQCTDKWRWPLPTQTRKASPEAICSAYGHNSKRQARILNPKRISDCSSFRPSGLENIQHQLRLTQLLSYLFILALWHTHQCPNLQTFRRFTNFRNEKYHHRSLTIDLFVLLDNYTNNWELQS